MKAIVNAHLIDKSLNIESGYIIYDKNIIDYGSGLLPDMYKSIQAIDVKGQYIIPGLIDIHTHGAVGYDFLDVDDKQISKVIDYFNLNGVTSFLATTVSASEKKLVRTLSRLTKLTKRHNSLLGIHLEGPFLNTNKAGAHQQKYLSIPKANLIEKFIDVIKVITFAPEIDSENVMKQFANKGIVLSMGHTEASYEQGLRYLEYIKSTTHIFNGMPSIHHRSPSVTTAVLLSDVYAEVIADKVHIHPAFLELLFRLKKDKIILVTDSISATGKSDGIYRLGNQNIHINKGIATLGDKSTLAGSTLSLIEGLKNFYKSTNASLQEVVGYATANPSNLLGLNDRGYIKRNYRADLLVLDKLLGIKTVIIGGKMKCV